MAETTHKKTVLHVLSLSSEASSSYQGFVASGSSVPRKVRADMLDQYQGPKSPESHGRLRRAFLEAAGTLRDQLRRGVLAII